MGLMITRLLRFMLLAALLLLAPLSMSQARTIHFTTDPEKQGGFLIEITKAAFARVGHEVKIEFQPWARALRSVMDGQTEALLGAYYNDERAAKMRYSDTIAKTDMLFFTLKGSPIVYRNIEDLRPYTVGTIIAADYPAEFNAAQFIRKEPVPDHVTNIRKLLGGRIDLFVEKKYVVLNTLRTQFPADAERIEALPVPLRENRYFNAFSRAFPENERIAADFNKGLAMIIADGTYEAIMNRGLHE